MGAAAGWRRAFARCVDVGRPDIELDRVALVIAAEEQPELDVPHYLKRLDEIGERISEQVGDELDPYLIVGILNRVLFRELGFKGNTENYYDPQNSLLNRVIDRRLGIPITLAVVVMESARRAGLPVAGVSFPGHFLVSYESSEERIFIDCFRGGEIVFRRQLQSRLNEMFDGRLRLEPEMIAPAVPRAIIARLLTNMKAIHLRRGDFKRALAATERLILVHPNVPEEYRDRGCLRYQLRDYTAALPDLEHYLALVPDAPDAARVRTLAKKLRGQRQG